ncbi:MAG TPA: metal-sulfur cluster assembly factor [Candidatus Obscuribacterales bacterium]
MNQIEPQNQIEPLNQPQVVPAEAAVSQIPAEAQPEAKAEAATASAETSSPAPAAAGELPQDVELSEETVRSSLEKVIDPELHMNIVELGLVYKVDVLKQGGPAPDVEVEMTLTSPGCPYGPMILGQIPSVVKKDFGARVHEVNVGLTFTPPWDPATMASEDVQFELGIF